MLGLVAAAGPWPSAQAEARTDAVVMTCTGATQLTLKPGLNATAKDFDITVDESVLECDDNRQNADTHIIGARVKGAAVTHGKGSCSKFSARIEIQIDWITADGAKPQQSKANADIAFDLTVHPVKLAATPKITDGLFAGYDIAADTPVIALDAFAKACDTAGGLTQVVGGHSIRLSRR
jgi:hypothetical protein